MTDDELIRALRLQSEHVSAFTIFDKAADRIEELLKQIETVLIREAETQVRHEAREDASREAALREALKVIDEWLYCADAEEEILALIGEMK
jgi:hypothetical protein